MFRKNVLLAGFLLFVFLTATPAQSGNLDGKSFQKPKYWSTIMQESSIGHLNAANKALRGRVITFEPGAVAKFHVHKFPGVRYILEGAVTVKRKDGTSKVYNAGSTFFEGPVGQNPAKAHEVSNDGLVVAKIWLVELIPEGDMKK